MLGLILSILTFSAHLAEAQVFTSEGQKIHHEFLVEGKEIIWGMDFLPDGKIIFTEISGAMRVLDPESKKILPIVGIPKAVVRGQGGLLDVRVHPDFAKNKWIYWTYVEEGPKGSGTVLARGELTVGTRAQVQKVEKLFVSKAQSSDRKHFGSRILFKDGDVYITLGDRDERKLAQSLSAHNGKVIRIKEDGKVPADNPFVGTKDALKEIWSYGHRNPQGIALHPESGEIWVGEYGPRGGDEINLLKKGANYGWPVVTHGREYWGPSIGEGTSKEGMEDPIIVWKPSISFSGINFYTGSAFPKWKNNLFLANLATQHLRRVVLDGTKAIQQEELLKNLNLRFRHVVQGPEGFLYFTTDAGHLGRLRPAE